MNDYLIYYSLILCTLRNLKAYTPATPKGKNKVFNFLFSTVLVALFDRIANLDSGHALVPKIGDLFTKNKKEFNKKAAEHTKKYALKR